MAQNYQALAFAKPRGKKSKGALTERLLHSGDVPGLVKLKVADIEELDVLQSRDQRGG